MNNYHHHQFYLQVTIVRGYITADQYTGSERDLFHQSGSGMELAINGDTGNVEDIAAAVLKSCPAILEVSNLVDV